MRTECPLNDRCFRFSVNLSNLFRGYVELRENGVNAEISRLPFPPRAGTCVIEESQSMGEPRSSIILSLFSSYLNESATRKIIVRSDDREIDVLMAISNWRYLIILALLADVSKKVSQTCNFYFNAGLHEQNYPF